jgi:hypothetical protein
MTQEEKQLLLKDLCARLPYGVKVDVNFYYAIKELSCNLIQDLFLDEKNLRPFLRPMSSMTEEEEREVRILWNEDFVGDNNWYHCYPKTTDFYLSHHLDFRNLIQKGLALEAPEGMYNINND